MHKAGKILFVKKKECQRCIYISFYLSLQHFIVIFDGARQTVLITKRFYIFFRILHTHNFIIYSLYPQYVIRTASPLLHVLVIFNRHLARF